VQDQKMKGRKILLIGLCVVAAILVALGYAVWLLNTDRPKRDRYLIPENYSGWLCVTYSVPGTPALEMEDGYRLVKFPASGVVETSTEGKPGEYYKDEFWRYSDATRKQMNVEKELGGGHTVARIENPARFTFMFWVGPDVTAQQPPDKPHKCDPAN
jgi:hypothetical protein